MNVNDEADERASNKRLVSELFTTHDLELRALIVRTLQNTTVEVVFLPSMYDGAVDQLLIQVDGDTRAVVWYQGDDKLRVTRAGKEVTFVSLGDPHWLRSLSEAVVATVLSTRPRKER